MKKVLLLTCIITLILTTLSFASVIDVNIKGIDDGRRTNKQRDYKEAVLFAKREAIERAGVKIKSITTVKDLMINSDYIESKAEAALLPGYQIMDIGYQSDGTYLVILIGKVKVKGSDDNQGRRAVDNSKQLFNKAKIAQAMGNKSKHTSQIKANYRKALSLYKKIIKNNPSSNESLEIIEGSLIENLEKKLKILKNKVQLRSECRTLSWDELKAMPKKYNFYEKKINPGGHFENYFVDIDEYTFVDLVTGLMWQKIPSDKRIEWMDDDVKNYVNNLNQSKFAGYSDWRLPTTEEINSIIKLNKEYRDQDWFWTCDPEKRNDYELYLFFLNAYPYRSYFGRMHTDTITGNAKVRVVRKYQDK